MSTNGHVATADLKELRIKVAQLETALSSRIVIEQAKGVLAERLATTVDEAFLLLRRSARSARINLHDLAGRVVNESQTPGEIADTVERLRLQ